SARSCASSVPPWTLRSLVRLLSRALHRAGSAGHLRSLLSRGVEAGPHDRQELSPSVTPTFDGLGVPADLVAVLAEQGINEPFPILALTIADAPAGPAVLGKA